VVLIETTDGFKTSYNAELLLVFGFTDNLERWSVTIRGFSGGYTKVSAIKALLICIFVHIRFQILILKLDASIVLVFLN